MRALLLFAALASACSGNNPAAPTPTPPAPTLATVTGHLTATNGGQALPGIAVAFGATSSTTDGSGTFSGAVTPTASMRAVLTGSGILPRTVYLAATATRDVAVDAFALDGNFDPTFYRELVRNGFEGGSEPLRRWTQSPNIYIQTSTDTRTQDMIEAVARDVIPRWTDNHLAVATVERGSGTREGQFGWLTIAWTTDDIGHCGTSQVGGGLIQFYGPRCGGGCAGYAIGPTIVRHELGHAMGFYHTDATTDVMFHIANQCDMPLSARERYHAALAYRRPVGNVDPDADSPSTVNLAPMRVY